MVSIIKQHLLHLFSNGVREDGRKLDEYREVKIEYGISAKSAEGSARVIIGKTEVIAGVKLEVGEPFPDNPDEGTIVVNAELLPLSNPKFESGPPGVDAVELSRVVDRALREGKAIDFKKLCIKEGEAMWMVLIDIYPINDDGNLFDAAALAALAAVKDAKFPALVEGNRVDYHGPRTKPLPLKHVPISCTVFKLGDHLIVDPTITEQEMSDARLTVAFMEDGRACAMQKGGDGALVQKDLLAIYDLAYKKTQELRMFFK